MSEWYKKVADKVKQGEQSELEEQELSARFTQVTKLLAPLRWRELCDLLEKEVTGYNEYVENEDSKRVQFLKEPQETIIRILKSHVPSADLEVAFDKEIPQLSCTYSVKMTDNTPQERRQIALGFSADNHGNVYIDIEGQKTEVEQVSEFLLKPVFDPTAFSRG